MGSAARPPLPLPAAPDSKRGPAGGQEDPEPGPHAREPRDFGLVQLLPLWGLVLRCCCCVYTGSCGSGSRPPRLPASTGRRRPEAARRALSTMRTLGTCLVTLAGLLLTAAGETFSGKRVVPVVLGAHGTQMTPGWKSPRRASGPGRGAQDPASCSG